MTETLRETDTNRPGWIFYEPAGPRPDQLIQPGDTFTARFWLDTDGYHVWQAHTCAAGERVVAMLPWPTWQVIDGGAIEPSISCDGCGFHQQAWVNCVVHAIDLHRLSA